MRRWRLRWTVVALVAAAVFVASALTFVLRRPGPQVSWSTSLRRPSGPVAAGSVVAVVDDDTEVVAFDAASGRRRWRWTAGASVIEGLVAADGNVYVLLSERVCAVDARTAQTRWCTGVPWLSATAGAGLVVVAAGERVAAHDAASGSLVWTRETPDVGRANPVVLGGTVYLAGELGLVACDPETGATRWRAPGRYPFRPHVYEDTVYAVRRDGATDRLEARFADDGAERYLSAMGGRASASPGNNGSLIVIAGQRGRSPWLKAFGTRTGRRRWSRVLDAPANGSAVSVGSLVAFEYEGRLRLYDRERGEVWGGREIRMRPGTSAVRSGRSLVVVSGRRAEAVRL